MTVLRVLACVLAFSVGISAQKKAPTGTIELLTANPALGVTVSFLWTADNVVGKTTDPRIQIICYRSDATIIFGTAGDANSGFLLGGASSPWLNDYPTEDVHCVADLYVWRFHRGQQFVLLDSTEFDAMGF